MQRFGTGELYAKAAATTANPTPTPRRFAILQDIADEISFDEKPLYGSMMAPTRVGRGKFKGSIKAKFATIDGHLFNDIFFPGTVSTGGVNVSVDEVAQVPSATPTVTVTPAVPGSTAYTYYVVPVINGGAVASGSGATATGYASLSAIDYNTISWTAVSGALYNIYRTVGGTTQGIIASNVNALTFQDTGLVATTQPPPALTPYTYVCAHAGTPFYEDHGVTYVNGQPLTLVSSAPTQGQYTCTNGTYGFAAADLGAFVVINYAYTVTTGYTVTYSNVQMQEAPYFELRLASPVDGGFNRLYPKCAASKLSMPTKQDDWTITEMDITPLASASGIIFTDYYAQN